MCMSPVGDKFRDRAIQFPALFSCTTIDWFLPWPEQALIRVAGAQTGSLEMYSQATKQPLVEFMAATHMGVVEVCAEYIAQFRRYVYVTPKTYLTFIKLYSNLYSRKFSEVQANATKISNGLLKLADAEQGVAEMQIVLAETEKELVQVAIRVEKMLTEVQSKSAVAQQVRSEVMETKNQLASEAATIQAERDVCNRDLEQAKPALDAAEKALDAIRPEDIKALKA